MVEVLLDSRLIQVTSTINFSKNNIIYSIYNKKEDRFWWATGRTRIETSSGCVILQVQKEVVSVKVYYNENKDPT